MSSKKDDALIYPQNSDNNNNEKKDILNKLLNKQQIIKSFSVKKEHYNILAQFMEIARRERKTFEEKDGFSSCVIRALKEYAEHHPLPNPQVTLQRSFNLDMPAKFTFECCVPTCKRKAKLMLTLKDFEGKTEQFQVCIDHARWRHKQFRFLMSCVELRRD